MSDGFPRSDVRSVAYIRGDCPNCGRARLEVFVDGAEDQERAVGVQCEKCRMQWLLNPETGDYYHEHDDRNPLEPEAKATIRSGGARMYEEGAMDG